jgi:hypothetical protein
LLTVAESTQLKPRFLRRNEISPGEMRDRKAGALRARARPEGDAILFLKATLPLGVEIAGDARGAETAPYFGKNLREVFAAGFPTRAKRAVSRLRRDGWGRHHLGREVIDTLLLPSDILRVRRQYTGVFGFPPRLLRPRTFNEKLQSSKILARRSHHTRFADKLAVRDFVRERIGPEVLTQFFWTGLD